VTRVIIDPIKITSTFLIPSSKGEKKRKKAKKRRTNDDVEDAKDPEGNNLLPAP
jgi:hypothetical protein